MPEDKPKLKVLDLFSGILVGGFSLGLERTGGFETVAFCEIEPFPRRVLAKHWPGVPQYHDVRTLTADVLRRDGIAVDVITGGFPCQDLSVAGKQRGMGEGTRSGLWSEIVRLVSELRPQFVIVENVAALLSGPSERRGGWFGRVLGDLAECGYDAEWENIPAAAVGAPHRRERVWLVAYPNQAGCEAQRPCAKRAGASEQTILSGCASGATVADPHEVRAIRTNGRGAGCAPADEAGRSFGGGGSPNLMAHAASIGQSGPWQPVVASDCAPKGEGQADHAVSIGIGSIWRAEPDVGRVAHGVPDRAHRLAALGNAVVPAIPELIGHAILQSMRAA